MTGSPHVAAVLVVHDGRPWLPAALAGLAAQSRAPDVAVAVDTGSRDDSVALLPPAWGPPVVLDRATGFGAAVRAGVARADALAGRADYLWLLHDDAVPAPAALEELVATAERTGAALVGCKERDSTDPRVLLAVGLTVDRAGRRSGPVRPGEVDQGQHDGAGGVVLAASTAGLLVRRDAWDALGGLDPGLPLFHDDVDLGWRAARAGLHTVVAPGALIRHDRAAARGHRAVDVGSGAPRRLDRTAAGYVQVVNAPGALVPVLLLRWVLTGCGRAVLALLARHPGRAGDEAWSAVALLARPGRLRAGRAWRRSQAAPRDHAVRGLLAPPGRAVARRVGAAVERSAGRRVRAVGGAEDEGEDAPARPATSPWAWFAAHPGAALTLVVGVVAVLAERNLFGSGVLAGGRLLPAPGSDSALWHSWSAGWHPSSAGGSGTAAPPWTPWLALLSTITLGRPGLAVDLIVLGAAPLAAWSAWRAGRELTPSRGLRLWGAAAWATLPVASGAVAQGRFDSCVALVAVPALLAAGLRLVRGAAPGRWRRAFATGLGLAVAAAFSPPLWTAAAVLVAVVVVLLVVTRPLDMRERLLPLAAVVVPAPLLALPWLPHLAAEPRVLLAGLGVDGGLAPSPSPHPLGLLLLRPGGAGLPPATWVAPFLGVVVLVAILLTARTGARGRQVAAAWGVATVGFALAVAAIRLPVDGGRPWTGPFLAVAAAGVLGAVLTGAAGAAGSLTGSNFGWRQLGAAALTACCLLEPVLAGAAWIAHGADRPLVRSGAPLLPPDLLSDIAATHDPTARVLVLSSTPGGVVRWDLRAVSGPVLGDEDLVATARARMLLTDVVADLAVPRGSDAALVLASFDVRAVAVPGSRATALTRALDGQTGLLRRATPLPVSLWQLVPAVPVGSAQLLAPSLADAAEHPAAASGGSGRAPALAQLVAAPPAVLDVGTGGSAQIVAGPAGRLLVMAQGSAPGWHATMNGAALQPVRAWGWAQAFRLPAAAGRLTVSYDAGGRPALVGLDVVLVVVLLALALPATGADDRRVDTSGTPR